MVNVKVSCVVEVGDDLTLAGTGEREKERPRESQKGRPGGPGREIKKS
jgi:hypothetical protein